MSRWPTFRTLQDLGLGQTQKHRSLLLLGPNQLFFKKQASRVASKLLSHLLQEVRFGAPQKQLLVLPPSVRVNAATRKVLHWLEGMRPGPPTLSPRPQGGAGLLQLPGLILDPQQRDWNVIPLVQDLTHGILNRLRTQRLEQLNSNAGGDDPRLENHVL